jgi:hypothetical protein
MGIVRAISVTIIAVFLTACGQGTQKEIADLKATVASLKAETDEIKHMASQGYMSEAALDVTSKSFAIVDAKVGRFYVRIKSVRPYLDGQKLELEIGNPYATTFGDVTIKLSWGPKANNNGWETAPRRKEFSDASYLLPGFWTPIEIILDATAPGDLSDVKVGLELKTVRLSR